MRPEGLDKLKIFSALIGSRTRDLSACGTLLRYACPHFDVSMEFILGDITNRVKGLEKIETHDLQT
jgi:hypothetical protein